VLGGSVGSIVSVGHNIGKNTTPGAMTACSSATLTAHDVVVVEGFLHEIHGVLVSTLHVLVIVGIPRAKPLLEPSAVPVPALVGSADVVVDSFDRVNELSLLAASALRVRRDGIGEGLASVLNGPETLPSFCNLWS